MDKKTRKLLHRIATRRPDFVRIVMTIRAPYGDCTILRDPTGRYEHHSLAIRAFMEGAKNG